MNKRTAIIISLIAILALAIALAYAVTRTPPTTAVYVNPQSNVKPTGQNFTVDIRISGVSDLYGWELKLSWNSTLLDAVNVTEGTFLQSGGHTLFSPKVNSTDDHILADCTLLGNIKGVNGTGTLATIQFTVKNKGECSLHLYDVTLLNSNVQSIAPTLTDGRFSTT